MGIPRGRWLTQSCLLRRLNSSRSERRKTQLGAQTHAVRRESNAAVAASRQDGQHPKRDGKELRQQPGTGSRSIYDGKRLNNSRRALFRSLGSATPFVAHDGDVTSSSVELLRQTTVSSDAGLGKLAVDPLENAAVMAMWAEILETKHRLDGMRGVEGVWNDMRRDGFDLPTEGRFADVFWKLFLHATVHASGERNATEIVLRPANRLTTDRVVDYAKDLLARTGRSYPTLHLVIVGHWLRVEPSIACAWHKKLLAAGLGSSQSILDVVDSLMTFHTPHRALTEFFKVVYKSADRRDLYDTVLGSALRHELPRFTLQAYHRLLVDAGDMPSASFAKEPRVRQLFRSDSNRDASKDAQHAVFASQTTRPRPALGYTEVNRELMNTIVGEVYDIKPKEFSDEFCARMFATRAFAVRWVINGLALFGVEKLGPLATREMALRSGSPSAFCENVEQLASASIAMSDALFCRLLVKVAQADNVSLWQALMESDQHPEAYDDHDTQHNLLISYLDQQLWTKAHLGLLLASLSGAHASEKAWNSLLQHYARIEDYPTMVSTMQSMQNERMFFTRYTLTLLYKHVLPRRDPAKRPQKGHGPHLLEPTTFVAKAFVYASERGTHAWPRHWVEVLKRLGMNHQWEPFERVVLTLLPATRKQDESDQEYVGDGQHTELLRNIFTSNMRKAVFIWGFQTASARNQLLHHTFCSEASETSTSEDALATKPRRVQRWAQGLPLLRRLHATGFDFPLEDIRVVFVQRMWVLFGPAYSTRPMNHEARRNNRLSLTHYIRHANEVWPGLVDWVNPQLLESAEGNDVRLLTAFFGDFQRVSKKRHELANINAWAQALGRGNRRNAEFVIEPRKTRAKERAWRESPLRVPYKPLEMAKAERPPVAASTITYDYKRDGGRDEPRSGTASQATRTAKRVRKQVVVYTPAQPRS